MLRRSAASPRTESNATDMLTAIHVTHEAVRKIGGIGTVLEGLINSHAYQRDISRTVLVGPLFSRSDRARLGDGGRVRYCSLDAIDEGRWHAMLGPICREYGVEIVYGTRPLRDEWTGRSSEVEVILIDVADMPHESVNAFKWRLYDRFGIGSMRYEQTWDYEQYVRVAPPALAAIRQLVPLDGQDSAVVLGHEYMGLPTAYAALLADHPRLAGVFYAHEVAVIRQIVEEHPAHDTMFYNVLPRARAQGVYLTDVFGDQMQYYKHGLVSAADRCDGIFAVGRFVRDELAFLSKSFATKEIELVPNGVPAVSIPVEERQRSRRLLLDYAAALIGWRPTFVFSHVARLVASKAFWRDIHVLYQLDRRLADHNQCAVLFVLSTEGVERTPGEIRRMEAAYGWPWAHRVGYPDLVGSEVGLNRFYQDFQLQARAIRIVFVNQFGWDRAHCGERMPAEMTFSDLRKGTDLEFGLSVYEPFGISQLEGMTFGALCMPSSVCGCVAFALQQSPATPHPNLIVADYVSPASALGGIEELVGLTRAQADAVLAAVSAQTAERAVEALHQPGDARVRRMELAFDLAARMSWDIVAEHFFLPGVHCSLERARERAGGGRDLHQAETRSSACG
jgi:glycosyltransferase involved in cell wall biosynthesis